MIKEILNVEGPVIGFLDKIGQLIVLSVLWLLGCVPVITVGTSTAALYYAVIKSVRRGHGSAVREFFRSYRANLGRGICVTATAGVLAAGLVILRGQGSGILSGIALTGMILLGSTAVYLGPVLSRFRISFGAVWKLAFVMSFQFAHYSLLLLAGTVALILLQFWVIPIAAVLILPGAWCFLSTFVMEKVLRSYMPEKAENDDAWYYES